MNGSALLRSAFNEVSTARLDCIAGAKAEAEPTRIAADRAANFIIVKQQKIEFWETNCLTIMVLSTTSHDKDRGFSVQQGVCVLRVLDSQESIHCLRHIRDRSWRLADKKKFHSS